MGLKQLLSEKESRRKVVLLGVTVALVAALLAAGTLAWVSLNQAARNETTGNTTHGGRLHDDFDGENKDVYAENYGTSSLLVRIRLDEHYEYGKGAGLRTGDPGYNDKAVTVLTKSGNGDPSDINDVNTWQTHIPFSTNPALCPDDLHSYFTWVTGGQKDYMPTFNKDNTDLSTDAAGVAIDGATGSTNTAPGRNPGTDDNDGSHSYWTAGDTHTDTADLGGGTSVSETHTAKPTLNATVISMADWVTMGRPSGAYWVYDTDGWAYWAQALQPNTSTGLLLDEIQEFMSAEEEYYYGINVVGQFASSNDYSAFYDIANGAPVKQDSDAEYLIKQNAKGNPTVHGIDITPNPVPNFIVGVTTEIDFNAILSGHNLSGTGDSGVTWEIDPGHGGSFDTVTGKFTGAANVGEYTVTAKAKDDTSKSASVKVKVTNLSIKIDNLEIQNTTEDITDGATITDIASMSNESIGLKLKSALTGHVPTDTIDMKWTVDTAAETAGVTFSIVQGDSTNLMIPADYVGTITVKAESVAYPGEFITFTAQVDKLENVAGGLTEGTSFYADGIPWHILTTDGSGNKLIMTKYVPTTNRVTLTTSTTYSVYNSSLFKVETDNWYAANVLELRNYALAYQFKNTTGNEGNWSNYNSGWGPALHRDEAYTIAGAPNTGTTGIAFLPSVSEINGYAAKLPGGSINGLSSGPWLRTPGNSNTGRFSLIGGGPTPGSVAISIPGPSTSLNRPILPFMWIHP